ncbi:MAG: 2-isopropylmalate synthase [Rickettsiales bacterium]|nr:2-isopropylmalate synthase [Rickettsiales bacterium]
MAEKIIIFDTTLRDGEQSAGATMNHNEKLAIAELLDQMGVDIIEAGFAIASEGDFKAVNQIAKNSKNAAICSLARAIKKDIDRAAEAVKPAKHGRIHSFVSTSDIHLKYQIKKSKAEVLDIIKDTVSYARNLCEDIEWSAMDATRSEHDFLYKAIETAINAGARTINIPDTVGYAISEEYSALIAKIKNNVTNIDKAIISVHCQNDLGLATANSLSAIQTGARQVECTINGLGERAGNTALEEVVMAIKTRNDLLNFDVNIDPSYFARISRLVSNASGFMVQKNKAIVGANAFAHESGIHQDGMLKNRDTYEIMTPESVGYTESNLVLGKHSGSHAFKSKINQLGFHLNDSEIEKYFIKFKELADKKKEIYDADIVTIIGKELEDNNRVKFLNLEVSCGSKNSEARITLIFDSNEIELKTNGNGPIDAIFKAIRKLVPHKERLDLYQVHSVTHGTDAQADVTVRLENNNGKIYSGHGSDIDTLVASAKAYITALNKILNDEET